MELLQMRVEDASGETVVTRGEFVEPVQLQVVCQTLWDDLSTEDTAPAAADSGESAGIDSLQIGGLSINDARVFTYTVTALLPSVEMLISTALNRRLFRSTPYTTFQQRCLARLHTRTGGDIRQ